MQKTKTVAKSEGEGILFRGMRAYISLMLNKFLFSSVEVEGLENLPPVGTPTLLVGNHQNGLIDPLMVISTLSDRKVHIFTRGGVFRKSEHLSRWARQLGMIPAYRLNREGLEMVKENRQIMTETGRLMMNGATVLIYPEGTHAERCHLGEFSAAGLRMAFDAAAEQGFDKEVIVVPVGVHYDNYYGLRNRMLLRFGQSISLSQYYPSYAERPRTTANTVTRLVRDAVCSLVLDIADNHYDAYESLCISRMQVPSVLTIGSEPDQSLSQQLDADRNVMRNLEDAYADCDKMIEENEEYVSLLSRYKTSDCAIDYANHHLVFFFVAILCLLLLPIGIVSLWPSGLAWALSKRMAIKSGYRCFANLYLVSLGGMLIIPLLCTLTAVGIALNVGFIPMMVYLAMQPVQILFAWYYWDTARLLRQMANYMYLPQNNRSDLYRRHLRLSALKGEIHNEMEFTVI